MPGVAFSAAPDQGFRAGGHGVLKGGSARMPDNKVNGVDFVLPFRFGDGAASGNTPTSVITYCRSEQSGDGKKYHC